MELTARSQRGGGRRERDPGSEVGWSVWVIKVEDVLLIIKTPATLKMMVERQWDSESSFAKQDSGVGWGVRGCLNREVNEWFSATRSGGGCN